MPSDPSFPWNQKQGQHQPDQAGSAFDWIQGFGKSAAESIPELIGVTPSEGTQQFRQDNPVSGFASQLAGMAVPYAGWFKAVKYIKPLASAAESLAKIKNPLVAGAASTAAQLAPFEAGRLAANQAVGDQPFSSMLGATATDLALGSGIGGVLHGIASAGARDPKLPSIFPGIDVSLPNPLLARQMKEIIDSGQIKDPEMLGRANAKLNEALRNSRTEETPSNQKYVGTIAHDATPDAKTDELERQLNRLFRLRDNPDGSTVQTRAFATGTGKNFRSEQLWKEEAKEAGLPDGFESKGQYFRTISFGKTEDAVPGQEALKGTKYADTITNQLTRNMEAVDAGTFLTREADDGMFVIAKKYKGEVDKGHIDDKWLLFKTDQPGYFLPGPDKWSKYQVQLASWAPGANLAQDAGPVYGALKGYAEQLPLRNYMALAADPSGITGMIGKLLPQNLVDKSSEMSARFGEALREYMAPRIQQFRKSWRANWIANGAKVTYDRGEMLVNEVMNGQLKIDQGKSLVMEALSGSKAGIGDLGLAPIRPAVNALSDSDFAQVYKIWHDATPMADLPAMMTKGEISPETLKFMGQLDKVDRWNWQNLNKVEEATGRKPTEFKEGHYGLSRSWEGDTRVILKNESGEVVGVAAGFSRAQAKAAAQQMAADNPAWHIADEFSLSQNQEVLAKYLKDNDVSAKILNPSFTMERQDVRGFKYDTTPFTKQDFLKDYENSLRGRLKYQANLSTTDIMAPQLEKLAREDPAAYRMVTARLNDFAGVQSSFGKWQNRIVDHLLGPIMGPNSATKIVGETNSAMFHITLGMGKLSYPIVNMLQFVQTVVPETAFLLGKAPDTDLAGKYSFFAAGGTKGPVGGMATLSPAKLMWSSLQEMRNPSKGLTEAYQQAVNDRVLTPRIVEDWTGSSAAKVSDLKGVMKGDTSFLSWLRAFSEFLPAETERLSRSHAFTVGYSAARDFLKTKTGEKLNADQLYQFAKQFTENTMYMYGASDKPRVFTTPTGSLMGLFKNWMFHYIASMGEYTQQGFTRNNWAPLLWQTGGTAAIGGLAATPIYGAANAFSKLFSNKSLLDQTYDQFDQKADGVMYGLPALMGVSLSSGVDVPAISNPVRDGASLFSLAAWSRAQAIGKAAGAAFDHWQTTGEHPAYDRGVRELLMRSFAPSIIYRTLGAINPDQITSLGTGYPLAKNVSTAHRVLYSLGFNPIELQRGQEISQELYESHEKLVAREKSLGDAWASAEMNGDNKQMALIMRQGMVWGVDIGKVIKEGMQEISRTRKDLIERRMRPQDLPKYKRIIELQAGEE